MSSGHDLRLGVLAKISKRIETALGIGQCWRVVFVLIHASSFRSPYLSCLWCHGSANFLSGGLEMSILCFGVEKIFLGSWLRSQW